MSIINPPESAIHKIALMALSAAVQLLRGCLHTSLLMRVALPPSVYRDKFSCGHEFVPTDGRVNYYKYIKNLGVGKEDKVCYTEKRECICCCSLVGK